MSGRVCDIDGCGRKHHAHGWCVMHYWRWRHNGDLGPVGTLKGPLRHGTVSCYTHGCRRPECRAAQAASMRSRHGGDEAAPSTYDSLPFVAAQPDVTVVRTETDLLAALKEPRVFVALGVDHLRSGERETP